MSADRQTPPEGGAHHSWAEIDGFNRTADEAMEWLVELDQAITDLLHLHAALYDSDEAEAVRTAWLWHAAAVAALARALR